MITFITYYLLLTLFLRFPALEIYRKNLTFQNYISIALITFSIFIYNCYKINTESEFFFGISAENKIIRTTLLLFFITSFATYVCIISAQYFRSQSDKKVPIHGKKGIRGKRGNNGKQSDVCDEESCRRNICKHKLYAIVSNIYSKYLNDIGESGPLKGADIANHFLKHKIELLCQSEQLKRLVEEKGSIESYAYIEKQWETWLHIILKYDQGRNFIDNPHFTDNDFDNLIRDSDKLYSPFSEKGVPGTPSRGLESPFDEIKKYDMWYWGEPQEAKFKVQYKCSDNLEKGTLKLLHSNNYKNIWRSNIARQMNVACDNEPIYIPFLRKGDSKVSGYRPLTIENEEGLFKPVGDVILKGDINSHKKTSQSDIKPGDKIAMNYQFNKDGDPKDTTLLVTGDTKSPIDFERVFASKRETGVGIGIQGYTIWKPIPPPGYKCLGYMLNNKNNLTKPSAELFSCVPEKCVKPVKSKRQLWKNNFDSTIPNHLDCSMGDLKITKIDTDVVDSENGSETLFTKDDSTNYNLFTFSKTGQKENAELYELIMPEEGNSCVNARINNIMDDSEWIVHEKNSEDYSIHSYFDK